MKNIDCEVYISNLISFFENNPNDLITLIGDLQKKDFYNKLRQQCYKNAEKGDDHVVTKDQIIDIIIELKIHFLEEEINPKMVVEGIIQKTKWGEIFLN